MKRRRASSDLRELVQKHGAREVAKRTGYAERTIARAARTGKLSSAMREGVREAKERSERARRAAKERAAHKTRVDLPLERAGELARATGVTERTARAWIRRGASPAAARDVAVDLRQGRSPLNEPEAGKRKAVSEELEERAARTMRAFVELVRARAPQEEIARAYRAWRRAKLPVRRAMTRAAWEKLVTRVAGELGLPDIGVFSAQRFRKS